jgi:hypothetical protein
VNAALHFNAMRALLEADELLDGHVEDTARVDQTGLPIRDNYVILFGGGPDVLDDDRLAAPQLPDSDAEFSYTVRSVAIDADGARMLSGRAFSRFVGVVPTVEGRKCRRIRHTGGAPVVADNSVRPPLFYCDDDYALNSDRV